jgi:ABC-type sulfate/molybdate transport systems ATPase subunit
MLWLDAGRPRRAPATSAAPPGLDPAVPLAWITPGVASGEEPLRVRVVLPLGTFHLDVAAEAPSRIIAVLGPSGAGKSLLLRTVAGFVTPSDGRVELAGRVLLDTARDLDVPPERRRLAYVAQRDALFADLDVAGNIGFALADQPAEIRRRRVDELVAAMGLRRVAHARAATLSGGERQRVGLARALAMAPAALLLDEPFSALDPPVRRGLRALVRDLHDRTGLPIVLVTHDRDDVLELADEVIVLEDGKVSQVGPVEEVFAHPTRPSVARLLGIPNVLAVRALDPAPPGRAWAVTDWGPICVPAPEQSAQAWNLAIPTDAVVPDPAGVDARVVASHAGTAGWIVRLDLLGGGESLEAVIPRDRVAARPTPGQVRAVRIDGTRCHLMPVEGQAAPEARPVDSPVSLGRR